jgi:phage baseplate assembly protein W
VRVNDQELIKRDLLNHFAIRKGEKLMNPDFGSTINDLLMEPLTEDTKNIVIEEVTNIVNTDPRINAEQITLDEYENGIYVEAVIRYATTNEIETLRINFDRPAAEQR